MISLEKSQKYPTTSEVMEELRRISNIGIPIAAMSLVGYLKNMVLVICMGRLGNLQLAGGALAIGFTNITGYSVLSGLSLGMEPLCTQAFGSRNLSLSFLTFQRTLIILLLASLPIGLVWFNLEPLLLFLHQNPDITKIASLYSRFVIPDLLAISLLQPLRIFLRSKGITWPLLWSNLSSLFLHIPITIYFTFYLSLGVKGLAISSFINNFITLFTLISFSLFPFRDSNNSLQTPLMLKNLSEAPTWAALCGGLERVVIMEKWGVLIRHAMQSCLGVCLEWWWYEFMTLLAGYLHNPHIALATSAIVIQTTSLMYTLPSALSASISTRVGFEIGAGQPGKARLAAILSIGLSLLTSLVGLVWTNLGKETWGRIFTKDSEILKLTVTVLPIIGMCEIANCPQTTSCGILRGIARPGIGAGINFYSFYLVGTPVAIVFAFVGELGFVGLCYGLLAAQISCVVSLLTVVYRTDWERESLKAKDLMARSTSCDVDGGALADHQILTREESAMFPSC